MTWIKISRGPDSGDGLILPSQILPASHPHPDPHPDLQPAPPPNPTWTLHFGSCTASITLHRGNAACGGTGATMSDPAPVQIAPRLLAQLHIRTEPVYRLLVSPGRLNIGPVLGLIVDDHFMLSLPQPAPRKLADAYARTGGLYVAFSPRASFLREDHGLGVYFDPAPGHWQTGFVPLPKVAYRRDYGGNAAKVLRLRRQSGVHVFNSRRLDKWEMHRLLSQDQELRNYLPETIRLADGADILHLLKRHSRVVLKPAALSRGRGIVFVEKRADRCVVVDYRRGHSRLQLTAPGLLRWVRSELRGSRYLCQQWLPLARVRGAPFDVRIVMQRGTTGRWRCSGLLCRVAARDKWVTNLARGGSVMQLPKALRGAFGSGVNADSVRARLVELGHSICERLESSGESLAELGLDLALDTYGRMWYLETNMRPAFQGFARLDPDRYRRILVAPFLYANHLAGFG